LVELQLGHPLRIARGGNHHEQRSLSRASRAPDELQARPRRL
jgi:hypothetical protein